METFVIALTSPILKKGLPDNFSLFISTVPDIIEILHSLPAVIPAKAGIPIFFHSTRQIYCFSGKIARE